MNDYSGCGAVKDHVICSYIKSIPIVGPEISVLLNIPTQYLQAHTNC